MGDLGVPASPSGQSGKPRAAARLGLSATVPNAESLPCIVCRKALEDAMPEPSHGNQPYPGLEFTSRGHYGSTIFDMEPGALVVNVCDDCVSVASGEGLVRRRTFFGRPHEARAHPDKAWISPKASAMSAGTAETGTGSVHEGAGPQDIAK